MKNKVIQVSAGMYKTLCLRESELWLNIDKVENLEALTTKMQKRGLMKSGYKIPLSSIAEVSYNEASEQIKLGYTNEKDKYKKLKVDFKNSELSNAFGRQLGQQLGLTETVVQERKWKPLLFNLGTVITGIFSVIVFATLEDSSEIQGSSRKSKGRAALVRIIFDTIGQKATVAMTE